MAARIARLERVLVDEPGRVDLRVGLLDGLRQRYNLDLQEAAGEIDDSVRHEMAGLGHNSSLQAVIPSEDGPGLKVNMPLQRGI